MAEAWNEDASKTVNDALTEKISVIGESSASEDSKRSLQMAV